jgi:hypothetical protein
MFILTITSAYFHIINILTWYHSHFIVAFNVLVFSHVPSDNLRVQVHRHASPKAFCQFNIMRVMRRSGLVYQSNNHPSGLIFFHFFFFLAQAGHFYVLALASPSPLSTLLKFSSLSALARFWAFLDFGPSSASFDVWLIVSHGLLSAPFGVLTQLSALLNMHSLAICHHRWPPR